MPRKRGNHNKPKETKIAILKFLLDNLDGVDEPDLRIHLKETQDIIEQKNIKTHLKDLLKQGSLKKEGKRGLANRWSIGDLKHLAISYEELIPALQKNERVLDRIINSSGFLDDLRQDQKDILYHNLVTFMRLSKKGFKFFLMTDSVVIEDRIMEVFVHSERGIKYKMAGNTLDLENNDLMYARFIQDQLDAVFAVCISQDILDGDASPAAMKYLGQMNKNSVVLDVEAMKTIYTEKRDLLDQILSGETESLPSNEEN